MPSWNFFQQPPLLILQRKCPEAVKPSTIMSYIEMKQMDQNKNSSFTIN